MRPNRLNVKNYPNKSGSVSIDCKQNNATLNTLSCLNEMIYRRSSTQKKKISLHSTLTLNTITRVTIRTLYIVFVSRVSNTVVRMYWVWFGTIHIRIAVVCRYSICIHIVIVPLKHDMLTHGLLFLFRSSLPTHSYETDRRMNG